MIARIVGKTGFSKYRISSSLCAINTTTIKVTFAADPSEADLAKVKDVANYSLTKGTVEAVAVVGKVATLSVSGLSYGDSTTVTVTNPAYTKEVKVPAINELFELVITTDAENDTIKSDGASTTMLTAKVIEKETGKAVVEDAQIQFTTTLGSLSQPQVALVNGAASTQLRSTSSATSLTAVVNATVASAPGATEYVGLTGAKVVNFTPDGVKDETKTMVSAVSAGADQGDRFYVKFSGDISAADYKKVVLANGWSGENFGIQYVTGTGVSRTERDLQIVDVYNVTPDTLMFVLDTDFAGSIAPTVGTGAGTFEMIDAGYTAAAGNEGNFLRDNVNHKIVFPDNITDLVVNSSDISFMMSDVTKPFIYGVDAKTAAGVESNMALTIRASEALSQALTETTANKQTNPNFTIDGKVIRLNDAPSTSEVNAAKAANEIIVTSLTVGEYNATTGVDNRDKVYITIHKDFKLASGSHGIQIANIGDLAGHTDSPANKVTTQTFPFTVAEDTSVPTATVTAQSPEQWLIEFNRPVDNITGKDIEDAIKIFTKEGYAADPKASLTQGNTSAAGDYIITQVDENGMAIGGNINTTTQLSGVERLLVEFNRDWSVKLQGNATDKDNYWKSGLNPFKVVLGNLESTTGVVMPETALDVTLAYDGQSPVINTATDLFEVSANKAFRGITATGTGQHVFVKMSEPVQLVQADGTPDSNPTTPNLEQDAVSPGAYDDVDGLPRPTYRFVKGDEVVLGNVAALAEDDQSFIVTPATTLGAGTWTLYIEQISDDHGNTSATISKQVVVKESEAAVTDTKVAWAAFDNNAAAGATDYDYLYVKFTKEMKAYTANGVDATTNYKFRGYDLPEGSQVFRGIDNVTDDWDGVTIRMPKGAWDGLTSTDFTTNMSVASNFESATGEKLSKDQPVQFELTDAAGTSTANKDGVTAANRFEAVYYNDDATTQVGGVAVIAATAQDSDTDGDIDTVVLTTSQIATVVAGTEISVNGKKFVYSSGTGSTTLTFVANGSATAGSVGTGEIAGTVTKALDVKTKAGATVINTGKVVDGAPAALTKAELSSDTTQVTLTFSEGVTNNNGGTFAALVAGDFTFAGTPAATVTGVEHKEATPNKVILTVSNGAALSTSTTFDAKNANVFGLADQVGEAAGAINLTGAPTAASLDAAAVAADKALVNVTPLTNLVADPTITAAGTLTNGSTLSWGTSDATVIDNTGLITRAAYSPAATSNTSAATLTATITKNAATDTKAFNVTVLNKVIDETVNGTAASNFSLGAGTLDISTLAISGLVDTETSPGAITADIGDFDITAITAGTDVTLTGANAGNDDGSQTIELTTAGVLTGTALATGDVFDVTVTLTDAAGNSVDVVLTITVTA